MIIIRDARIEDAKEIVDIFTPYVLETAITSRKVVGTVEERAQLIEKVGKSHAYLVAEEDGEVIGYSYAAPVRIQCAYAHSAETSIYLKQGVKGKKLGRRLYEALFKVLKEKGYKNLYAVVVISSDKSDPRLPTISRHFHKSMGYKEVGEFTHCIEKFGNLYSIIWMEKML
jgi:phosphinothricin acetyltransferase